MNWLFVNGSPRKNGNTRDAISLIISSLISTDDNVKSIDVYDKVINPCIDCRACKKDKFVCTRNDDMQKLYSDLEEADYIVFGNPIYWSGVPGPMKNLIDRLRPYYKNRKLNEKKLLILSIGASADVESDLINVMYKRISSALGLFIVGHMKLNAFDIGDIRKANINKELIKSCYKI